MDMADEKFYKQILDIINSEDKYNVPEEIIHQIEDTDFTVEQSEIVSPWLIGFALENRDKHDATDVKALFFSVSSAIRTGASMLYPDQVERLFPLLEEGHIVDTSLVTVKMISRIFEAQPPSKIGEHEVVAEKIYEIINSMLNDSLANIRHTDVALIQLGITALVGMGSKKVYQILERIKNKEKWIDNYIIHNIKDLKKAWQRRKDPISSQMDEFINETINFFEKE
jgi:hypothetical protein